MILKVAGFSATPFRVFMKVFAEKKERKKNTVEIKTVDYGLSKEAF